ncbi:natriuretic peptides B [Paramormyrops kingsleyae]|uniref:Brain natriuretic peptide-like n=1 Tax=Paramormyrops kingsleyae TaxID=1676925 RepID=A0A3B3SXK5_9TELE|nr:brain natriuretic peptide-like [Paramormyrops kingsleyae]
MLTNAAIFGLLMFANIHLLMAFPMYRDTLTGDDLDVLKDLIEQLEAITEMKEVAPFRTAVSKNVNSEDTDGQPQLGTNQYSVERFLSPQDLKAVRNDSGTKKTSGCFGRRMDRIGSMSTLGCNVMNRKNS